VRNLSLSLALLGCALPCTVASQLATVGGGLLISKRPSQPVVELHAESPPLSGARAYVTFSWTDESAKPTIITAAEHPVVRTKAAVTGLGAGLLWLAGNEYRPYPILVSSTVVPLPIRRTAAVAIASVQPFQEFEWSFVVKVGVTLWFGR
jgi:hypothetical protein